VALVQILNAGLKHAVHGSAAHGSLKNTGRKKVAIIKINKTKQCREIARYR